MMDPFMGLVQPGVTFGWSAATYANDNAADTVERDDGFYGLLLRATGDTYEIILCHQDETRSQRVESACDDTDIIALWRSIGRKCDLPLLAETPDGAIVQIEPSPWLTAGQRRGGSPLTHRRPRFLSRRKVGAAPQLVVDNLRSLNSR